MSFPLLLSAGFLLHLAFVCCTWSLQAYRACLPEMSDSLWSMTALFKCCITFWGLLIFAASPCCSEIGISFHTSASPVLPGQPVVEQGGCTELPALWKPLLAAQPFPTNTSLLLPSWANQSRRCFFYSPYQQEWKLQESQQAPLLCSPQEKSPGHSEGILEPWWPHSIVLLVCEVWGTAPGQGDSVRAGLSGALGGRVEQ